MASLPWRETKNKLQACIFQLPMKETRYLIIQRGEYRGYLNNDDGWEPCSYKIMCADGQWQSVEIPFHGRRAGESPAGEGPIAIRDDIELRECLQAILDGIPPDKNRPPIGQWRGGRG